MNLDKLKELEGKATRGKTGGWGDYLNVVNYMWEHRKEMIETIERYKAALEEIAEMDGVDFEHGETSNGSEDIAKEALKDPEKTLDPTKS